MASAPAIVTVTPEVYPAPLLPTSKPALESQSTSSAVNEGLQVVAQTGTEQLTEDDMSEPKVDFEEEKEDQDQTDEASLKSGTEGAFSTVNDDFTTTVDPSIPTKESLQEEVKQSGEPLWAFTSLLILIIGLAVAIRRSKLLNRKSPRKAYSVQDSWSDDEGTISVGTLVRGFRRKSKDEQSYSLLETDDP